MKLNIAFKEWAVICRALAEGKQSILLRKGGIAEVDGEFTVAHTRFWLYPTYVHQQQSGIRAEARPFLEVAQAPQPGAGTVCLSHWVDVTGVYHVHDLTRALLLAHLHYWSDDTVRQRFHYREPGIYVLAARVHRVPAAHLISETATYQGCKSWVELAAPLDTAGSTVVLGDEDYQDVKWNLEMLLEPRATT